MATRNDDFLRFSAYSIKDLITRRLSEDTKFTDQIYEGSNLAILIDIVSHMFQCLMYSLNSAAAESMFADTQIYENINRLCTFLGYNPKGCTTANATFRVTPSQSFSNKCIMPYSCINTHEIDDNGNDICYSFVEPFYLNNEQNYEVQLYNGKWKLYNEVIVASGTDNETFVLNIASDEALMKYVAWPFVHVYAKRWNTGTSTYDYIKYQPVTDGLLLNLNHTVDLYNSTSNIYNIKLNQDKKYEIRFGNGYVGNRLNQGDELVIFYLDSNGSKGEIDLGQIAGSDYTILHNSGLFGLSQEAYNAIFYEYILNAVSTEELYNITVENITNSTSFISEETVEQIRQSAPFYNRTNNRLVSNADFEFYVKNNYAGNIVDVKCLNNWDYICSFYKWLYNLSLQKTFNHEAQTNGKYYLNENTLVKYDYKYADASDSNNVYLWVKLHNSIEDNADMYYQTLDKELYKIKVLTSEIVFLKPIDVVFDIFAGTTELYYDILKNGSSNLSYIEITVSTNTLYTSDTIKQLVYNKIIEFFDESNYTLGAYVDPSKLLADIYSISGIELVRTINNSDLTVIKPGISFATYSNTMMIDIGDDLDITASTKKLEDFLFPKMIRTDLIDYIKVIKMNTNNFSDVVY